MGLRVRAYACERMRREKMLGEAVISFAAVDLEFENNLWLTLEPRANSTVVSVVKNGFILINICYL